jgi:ribosomal protein S18 acetylase RimI-like enzyme
MTAGSIERTLMAAPILAGPGGAVLRTAGPDDADKIRAFVCGLSPQSQNFRFFASVAPPSTALLRALTGVTGSADILVLTDSRGTVIGHGMAADAVAVDGRLDTDIGLAIADDWQQRGLGTLLLDTLVDRASARGVSRLVLDVLPTNNRMRSIIARRWPDAPTERGRDAIIFRPAVRSPVTSAVRPGGSGTSLALPTVITVRRDRVSPNVSQHPGGQRVPDRSAA